MPSDLIFCENSSQPRKVKWWIVMECTWRIICRHKKRTKMLPTCWYSFDTFIGNGKTWLGWWSYGCFGWWLVNSSGSWCSCAFPLPVTWDWIEIDSSTSLAMLSIELKGIDMLTMGRWYERVVQRLISFIKDDGKGGGGSSCWIQRGSSSTMRRSVCNKSQESQEHHRHVPKRNKNVVADDDTNVGSWLDAAVLNVWTS